METKGNNFNVELINRFLGENNITKTKFCKGCGISYSTLRKLEKQDFMNLTLIPVFKIARFMKIHIKELFC